MNREKLFQHLEQHYVSKREMISRIPLGVQPDEIWQDVLNRRKAISTILPLHSPRGTPYWYVTTQKMASASDRIVTEMMSNETDFDPYRNLPATTCLEESFFTSYVEGSQLTMQAAMEFIQGDMEPQSAEEQLILNNRNALNFVSANLYRPVDEGFINTVAGLLNENMEIGGEGYRNTDYADIPSMSGLPYEVTRAFMIPDSVREITHLIADPAIHPLIKASIAHAWALTSRPYPDGNERLGRLLSQCILLRSGYHFFSEISLSSLIARKSFAYFNAMTNILLPENGSDMTYFVEYFLCLLADAIGERHLRLEAGSTDVVEAEREMAKQPLVAESSSPPTDSPSPKNKKPSEPPQDESLIPAGETESTEGGEYSYAVDKLKEVVNSPGEHIVNCARFLLERISKGLYTFTTEDIANGLNIDMNSAGNRITQLRQKRIIKTVEYRDTTAIYGFFSGQDQTFTETELREKLMQLSSRHSLIGRVSGYLLTCMDSGNSTFTYTDIASGSGIREPQAQNALQTLRIMGIVHTPDQKVGEKKQYYLNFRQEYSQEVLDTINGLLQSPHSLRDRRIGEALQANLSTGVISKATYKKTRWNEDMRLAAQIGIVEKVDKETYRILKQLKPEPDELLPYQKRAVTVMYESFGGEAFSHEMFVATVDYSGSHASAILHELTLIRVLDCWKEDINRYRLNVDPETKPKFFLEVA